MLEKYIVGLLIIIIVFHLLGIVYFYEHPLISYDSPIGYDKFLHFLGGAWITLLVYQQIKTRKFLITPLVLFFAFLIFAATTIGVFWEFFEFFWDQTFHKWYGLMPAQASLADTMFDLLWDFIGGLVLSFILWQKKLLQ